MKLFTPEIEHELQKQYTLNCDLEHQNVIAKIFNPYGAGTLYLINQDPDDPDYLWCIAEIFTVEVGSVAKHELEDIRLTPYDLPLEQDIFFKPINAAVAFKKIVNGEHF